MTIIVQGYLDVLAISQGYVGSTAIPLISYVYPVAATVLPEDTAVSDVAPQLAVPIVT